MSERITLQPRAPGTSNDQSVYLGQKRVGTIQEVTGGYQYLPKGKTTGGKILRTVRQVLATLQDDHTEPDES